MSRPASLLLSTVLAFLAFGVGERPADLRPGCKQVYDAHGVRQDWVFLCGTAWRIVLRMHMGK